MNAYTDVNVKCPFYLSSTDKNIRCGDFMEGVTTGLDFDRKAMREYYCKHVCQRDYQECDIYKMLLGGENER